MNATATKKPNKAARFSISCYSAILDQLPGEHAVGVMADKLLKQIGHAYSGPVRACHNLDFQVDELPGQVPFIEMTVSGLNGCCIAARAIVLAPELNGRRFGVTNNKSFAVSHDRETMVASGLLAIESVRASLIAEIEKLDG